MTAVAEIPAPRGAILTIEKLIQRTANGGVVYAVWCLGGAPRMDSFTDVRRRAPAEGKHAVRLRDGTVEERDGTVACMELRSLDPEEGGKLRPMALSALNLEGIVYRECFVFSLKEQAQAYYNAQVAKGPPSASSAPSDTPSESPLLRLMKAKLKSEARELEEARERERDERNRYRFKNHRDVNKAYGWGERRVYSSDDEYGQTIRIRKGKSEYL